MASKLKAEWACAAAVIAVSFMASIPATRAASLCFERVDPTSPFAGKAQRCDGPNQPQKEIEAADETIVLERISAPPPRNKNDDEKSATEKKDPSKPPLYEIDTQKAYLYHLDQATNYTRIVIGDSKVVDATPLQYQHDIKLVPLAFGETKIFFQDDKNVTIKTVNIQVKHVVEVINRPELSGSTTYRCWSTGCEYVKESEFVEIKNVSKVINDDRTPRPPEPNKPAGP